jgi:hypothetical protein
LLAVPDATAEVVDVPVVDVPAQTACTSDKTCLPLDLVCDPVKKLCVQCVTNGDCGGGATCKSNTSQPPPKPCTSSKQCDKGLLCDKASGQCVQCVTADDCDPGLACDGGAVVQCKPDGSGTAVVDNCAAVGKDCVNAACVAKVVCKAGEKACVMNGVATCKADGSGWSDPVPCAAGANACSVTVCEGGACVGGAPAAEACRARRARRAPRASATVAARAWRRDRRCGSSRAGRTAFPTTTSRALPLPTTAA